MTGWRRPWVIDGAMNSEIFTLYAETRLVPTLREGDVVILDNLSSHKAPAPRRPFAPSARFLFLPPYSPEVPRSRASSASVSVPEISTRGSSWSEHRRFGVVMIG